MKRKRARGPMPARSGSILVVVVFAVMLLASLAALFMTMSRSAHEENGQAVEQLRAHYAAEAGLNEAFAYLVDGGEDALDDLVYPQFIDDIELDLVVTLGVDAPNLDDDLIRLVSVADRQGQVRALEMIVRMGTSGGDLFRYGIASRKRITISSNSHFDAYDSALGDYASQQNSKWNGMNYADDDTSIASNSGISLASNSSVFGDASPGPSSSVSVPGSSQVTGSTASLPEPLTFPTLRQPVIASPGGDLSRNSGTKTLTAGDYYYSSLTLNSTAQLIVEGPARILVRDFEINSNASLQVDATNGGVEIWVLDDFELSSSSWIAPTSDDPADVSILFPGSGGEVVFNSNVDLIGTVYAPERDVVLNSNAHLYGAVVGNEVELDSNSAVHYDKNLGRADVGVIVAPDPEVLSWRPVADPRL